MWIVNLILRPLENMEGDRSPPFVLEIFHLKLYLRDFSFEDLKIFNEDLFIDFFLENLSWRFIL